MENKEIKVTSLVPTKTRNAFSKKIEGFKKTLRVALETHENADADGTSSMWAFQKFFAQIGIEADMFGSVGHSHAQNKAMVNRLQIDLKSRDFFKENKENYGCVILCDTPDTKRAYLKNVHPDIIIDHHGENSIVKNCLNIRIKIGATSTISYHLLKDLGMKFTPEVATALALGISIDTDSLLRLPSETKKIEVQTFDKLFSMGDSVLFFRIDKKFEKPRTLIELKGRGYRSVNYLGHVAIVGLGETKGSQEHYYGDIADDILCSSGIKLVVAIGIEEGKKIKASVRVDEDIDSVQIDEFCKQIFEAGSVTDTGEEASAGSNPTAGGADVPLSIREREEWDAADEQEKKVLFRIKMKRYEKLIKEELDLS